MCREREHLRMSQHRCSHNGCLNSVSDQHGRHRNADKTSIKKHQALLVITPGEQLAIIQRIRSLSVSLNPFKPQVCT